MFVDVENSRIHKGWNITNIPCPMAHPEAQVVDELLEVEIEREAEIAYQAQMEFQALYDFAKFEEQEKLKEVKLVEDVEVQKPVKDDYNVKCEIERAENMEIVIPRVTRLLINQKPGIALKRFIKRELDEVHPMITKETTHILRVESLQNGRRFNAIILNRYNISQAEQFRRIIGLMRWL
jgi:hypothetical protein